MNGIEFDREGLLFWFWLIAHLMGFEELDFGVRWCDWDEVIRNVLGEWSSGLERVACRSDWTIRIRERVFKKQTMLFS
jgi:hypothetical protein